MNNYPQDPQNQQNPQQYQQPQYPQQSYQPPQYQQPQYQPQYPNQNPEDPGKGMGIASMVLGIIGLCTGWCWGVGAILGIIGIVLAIMSGNKSKQVGLKQNGLAIAGLVCSIIAVVCGAGCLICTISAINAVNSAPYTTYKYNYNW
ncbi:MAG: DUF4190 domain-containing protein [Candidatus Pseudoruminococcus sp.]|uniref:DUF4190 domain-containing protein n=1 Tax=Candidatus Pseudoruminococcus sp. TaxID=3101048 RepID=UPI002A769999|nr:DUF4190 domain-containing protein [Ruminococcus sp.]MDY2782599.1 DUF4190 domain-containing protein [Candidatus Pseudoruminococcus sp.]